jgi:hypothetical protein
MVVIGGNPDVMVVGVVVPMVVDPNLVTVLVVVAVVIAWDVTVAVVTAVVVRVVVDVAVCVTVVVTGLHAANTNMLTSNKPHANIIFLVIPFLLMIVSSAINIYVKNAIVLHNLGTAKREWRRITWVIT